MNVFHRRFLVALDHLGWREEGDGRVGRRGERLTVSTSASGVVSLVDRADPHDWTSGPSWPALAAILRDNAREGPFRILSAAGPVRRLVLTPQEWVDLGRLGSALEELLDDPALRRPAAPMVSRGTPLFVVRPAPLADDPALAAALAFTLLRRDHDARDGVRHLLPPGSTSIWDVALGGPSPASEARRGRAERPLALAFSARPDLARRLPRLTPP
jgi:hypothetical protein